MEYEYIWTCSNCGTNNLFLRTKFDAAFEHRPKYTPYTNCGGTKSSAAYAAMPKIDLELLEHWLENPELRFLEQDEDLILADVDLALIK